MQNRSKILVVAAHPDDEVLGCGGTIARMADNGAMVFIGIMSTGSSSRFNEPCEEDRVQQAELRQTSREVAQFLGAKQTEFFEFPDNAMDTGPLLEVVKTVENLIDKYSPDTILTHFHGDLNIDHQVVSRAVSTAARPLSGCPVKNIYEFEVASSTEWSFSGSDHFSPNHFVEIGSLLEKKITAMERYRSETRSYPHPRSAKALRALAQWRGAMAGTGPAEAFHITRQIHAL